MKAKYIILGMLITSTLSFARGEYRDYEDDRFEQQQITTTSYVKVVKRVPLYETTLERVPHEHCRYVEVPVERRPSRHRRIDDKIGTIIGGVAGGILGHQIGGGHGKTVATIGGAIIGSAVGSDLSHRNGRHYDDRVYYEKKKVCETRYTEKRRKNRTGYENIGYFKGQKIIKYSHRKLRKIPVTITISY